MPYTIAVSLEMSDEPEKLGITSDEGISLDEYLQKY